MTHVFISYSKKNRDYVRKFADKLLEEGFDVWIDDRIDFGESWERAIFEAIDACDAFVVIMTPESYASVWVMREYQYAEKRNKQPFPVLLAGEEFPRYGPTQYIDVRDGSLPTEDFYERLAEFSERREEAGREVAANHAAHEPRRSDDITEQTIEDAQAEATPEALTFTKTIEVNPEAGDFNKAGTFTQTLSTGPAIPTSGGSRLGEAQDRPQFPVAVYAGGIGFIIVMTVLMIFALSGGFTDDPVDPTPTNTVSEDNNANGGTSGAGITPPELIEPLEEGLTAEDYFQSGQDAFYNGDEDLALIEFNRALNIEPGNPQYWYFLGLAQHDAELYEAAIESYTTSIELGSLPDNQAEPYYQRGLTRYLNYNADDTEFEAGMEDLRRVIDDLAVGNSNYALAAEVLGAQNYYAGNYEQAVTDLEKAQELYSRVESASFGAFVELAASYRELGQDEAAEQACVDYEAFLQAETDDSAEEIATKVDNCRGIYE